MSGEPYSYEQVIPIDQEPRHHLVIANRFVRAFIVEVPRRTRTLCHHHSYDYVVYVSIGTEIISAARGEEPKRLKYWDGECELSPAGLVHVVENPGDMPFRNLVVELLPLVGELQRGDRPSIVQRGGSEKRVAVLFSEARAAVFDIELVGLSEIKVPGPAIVAAPYGDAITLAHYEGNHETGLPSVLLNSAKLVWVPPGRSLGNKFMNFARPGRLVVFQVGSIDDDFAAVPKGNRPVKSLRAHADEPG